MIDVLLSVLVYTVIVLFSYLLGIYSSTQIQSVITNEATNAIDNGAAEYEEIIKIQETVGER